MEMRTRRESRITRKRSNQPKKLCPKTERNASLRKVSNILRKNESLRSAEEIAVLASMADEVREVKCRLKRREITLQRSIEMEDDLLILKNKCKKLAHAMQNAKHLVVYTGAGISTAADIPDYRGPNGIWTLLQQGKNIGKHDLTRAQPTLTHMALKELHSKGILKFIVSQNCDGLHLRSGLPRRALSEVHGNMYIELCRECKPNMHYWRLFDTTERTARYFHKTGRICHFCGGPLTDSIVHFGERGTAQWPLNWSGAIHHAERADVILCLGSSLKVLKKYPWLWAMDKPVKKRPAIFIVNLQWTPKDDVAVLKINGKCDKVMSFVMENLGFGIPKYSKQRDPIFCHASYLSPRELHTTTMAMLVRGPPKAPEIGPDYDKYDQDFNDPDEDCPLNILKSKIQSNTDKPTDLTISKPVFPQNHFHLGNKTEIPNHIDIDNCEQLKCEFSYDDDNCNQNYSDAYLDEPIAMNVSKNYAGIKQDVNEESVDSDYEKLQVEMKTSDSDTQKVSILLVKSPLKADEIKNGNDRQMPKIIPFDTGHIRHGRDSHKTDSSYKYLKTETDNIKSEDKPPVDLVKDVNTLSMLSKLNKSTAKENLLNGSTQSYLKQKACSSLRHFRKMKCYDSQLCSYTQGPHDDHMFPLQNGVDSCAIDLTMSCGEQTCTGIPLGSKAFNRVYPPVPPVQIAKVEERPSRNSGKLQSKTVQPLDLSKKCNDAYLNRKHTKRKLKSPTGSCVFDSSNENSLDSENHEDTSYEEMFTEYQALAQAIIQHTLVMSRCEVKYAYSGFHSIINPVPFVQYDFHSVFNALNFLKYGQMLLNKKRRNIKKPKKVNNIKKCKIVKKKVRLKSYIKKEPQCQYCHEHYRVYYCKFYTPHNSDDRFEKYRNNKLVMCLCCDSETSDEDEGSDDKDSKLDPDDSTQEEITDKETVDVIDEDSPKSTFNGCPERVCDERKSFAQPGWFGKGYRKNRRRKR